MGGIGYPNIGSEGVEVWRWQGPDSPAGESREGDDTVILDLLVGCVPSPIIQVKDLHVWAACKDM